MVTLRKRQRLKFYEVMTMHLMNCSYRVRKRNEMIQLKSGSFTLIEFERNLEIRNKIRCKEFSVQATETYRVFVCLCEP